MKQMLGCVLLGGTAALMACATSGPASKPAAPAVTPTAAPASSAPAAAKFTVPYGYERVVLQDGTERFCRNDLITGSRTQHSKVCLTQAQLQASQNDSQSFIDEVQRHGGASTLSTTPGAGGAMGGGH